MQAILKKIGPQKTKPITGRVLQEGLGRITLIIRKPDGTEAIKRFDKSKYVVTYF